MPDIQQILTKIVDAVPTVLPILIIVGIFIYLLLVQCAGPGSSIYSYFSNVLLPRLDRPLLIG
jgi:hypothetical protein